MKKLVISIIFCFFSVMVFSQINTENIRRIIQDKKATVGVAVIYRDKAYTVSNNEKYPLMSTFKFHIGVTALKKMETNGISLDSMVYIEPHQMHKNTYSPIRDRFPDHRIHISFREIIEYTISHSDNNTCDWRDK